ncbi:MAG TPA: cupin domain-containing protein [Candidatus Binatia bacterium]|nr:cupin domain-containing protein [Candidatus Binatia bacterium]
MQNISTLLLLLLIAQASATSISATLSAPKPTVFQANEGDRWLLLGNKPLIFKVDPVSTGSNTLIVGTEVMPPGNKIPTHKHLHEDEVLFIHEGMVRVTLAGRRYEAGTGATVFIPRGNWIGIENASDKTATIVFIFNKPAFERCLRAISSRPGQTFTMPAPAKMASIRAHCDEVMRD